MISATFDHVVITVSDLNRAIAEFSDQGFQVTRGGAHGHTEMAMVLFADGTYIELISLRSVVLRRLLRLAGQTGLLRRRLARRPDVYRRLISWFGSAPGPVDWCIRVANLDEIHAQWENLGIPCLETAAFQRTRPDGQDARWRLGSPVDRNLPFVIEDSTDIQIRVPNDPRPSHPNGALGIRCLQILVDDPRTTQNLLSDAFSSSPVNDQAGFQFNPTRVQFGKITKGDVRFQLELTCDGSECDLLMASMHMRLRRA